ncbi:MAG: 3-phosphoshikimate 1-carboxyvinyltransferase [Planctomycetes bacterium]|nr:3-phosphoshikimate 1-carboxyvinyltransferase [Planctomycetota bacterium]
MSDPILVPACAAPRGLSIRVPGSKSLSCRALVLASLAEGTSNLRGVLRGEDTDALAGSLDALGVKVQLSGDHATLGGGGELRASVDPLNLGHGGTPARFMIAVASLAVGETVIDGSDRLRERPMKDLVDLLRSLGVAVSAEDDGAHLPIKVSGEPWSKRVVEVGQTDSSQFLSALLLVAPRMPLGLEMRLLAAPTSAPYLAMTIAELRRWGVEVTAAYGDGYAARIAVSPGPIKARDVSIPADASSALFWAVAAAILPGTQLKLSGLRLSDGQPDAAAFPVLSEMGLQMKATEDGVLVESPERLRSVGIIDCRNMPDAAPALAVAACMADAPTRLTGLGTLRVKESDRVETIASELARAGASVEVAGDDLAIVPTPLPESPEVIQTWQDHRIAMAMAILGLRRGGLSIADPGCTAKSYPGFWEDLAHFAQSAPSGDTAQP